MASTVVSSTSELNWYTLNCACLAAVGSLIYGIDSGIISTTVAQSSYLKFFAPYTPDKAGAVVSVFAVGTFFGVIFAGWAADYLGRRRTIQLAALIALVAGIMQAAARDIGTLLAGRIVGGAAVGILNMTVPIYQAEISPPSRRGLVSGLHSQFVSMGFATANWVGYACSYITSGDVQWRLPLALQCVPAIILLLGAWTLPCSPRWLLEKGRDDEALAVYKKLHGSGDRATDEFEQMRVQTAMDRAAEIKSLRQMIRIPSVRGRLLIAIGIQLFSQLTGVNVINYYQTTLYSSLGITGRTVLVVAGFFGMVGPLANVVCLLYIDEWGRKPMIWVTSVALSVDIAVVMALTAVYAGRPNLLAHGITIGFIFLFSAIFSLGYNTIHCVYVPEILHQAIRARGSSIAVCSGVLTNIVFNQLSPRAFAKLGWRYYSVFVCTNAVGAVVAFLWFPETKGKTLEEINAVFDNTRHVSQSEEQSETGAATASNTETSSPVDDRPQASLRNRGY